MANFLEHMRQRLEVNGYKFERRFADLDLIMRSPDDKLIWICYLEVEIEPEQIRRMFDFTGHVLIVVNEKLIPDEIVSREGTPMWLRVIHGLWMGRVYVWNDRFLFGLHFDYENGEISESGIIQPDELLLTETGTWLRGWPGVYRLARFKDRAWWNESAYSYSEQKQETPRGTKWEGNAYWGNVPPRQEPPKYTYGGSEQKSSARQAYEDARDNYYRQQKERAQRSQYDSSGFHYDPNDWPGGKPPNPPPKQDASGKRDFMREFMACASKAEAKALFKKLAKEFHPDLSGKDTTADMQQINAAWDKAERMFK